MRAIDDFTLGLLTNSEVIAVNQDPLVAPAVKRVVPNGQVWYKKLCDGSYALGFFQLDPYFVLWDQDEAEAIQEQNYEFEFDLRELGIGGKAEVPGLVAATGLGYMHGHAPGAGTLPRGFAGQDNARGMSSAERCNSKIIF